MAKYERGTAQIDLSRCRSCSNYKSRIHSSNSTRSSGGTRYHLHKVMLRIVSRYPQQDVIKAYFREQILEIQGTHTEEEQNMGCDSLK